MNKYRAALIANQQCATCKKSLFDSQFKTCAECREARRKSRSESVAQGSCNSCGKPRENLALTLCDRCRKLWAARAPILRAKGLCTQCGKEPPLENKNTCVTCTKSRVKKFKQRYERAQAEHLCPHCLKPPIAGSSFCAAYLAAKRKYNKKLKDEVFAAYGGYVCACCEEDEPAFLQIDHIEQDGYLMRKQQGNGGQLYGWLRRHDFPDGYQVLCANCNWARSRRDNPSGICPHKIGTVRLYQAA